MRHLIILLPIAILLNACGGSGVSASPPTVSGDIRQPAPAPAPVPPQPLQKFDFLGVWHGSVTFMDGFNPQLTYPAVSLCTAGVELSIAPCIESVSLDGDPASIGDLETGQIVEIHGTRPGVVPYEPTDATPGDKGAVAVDIHRTLVGPVDTLDADHAQLTLLGQRVFVDLDTRLGYAALTDIAPGDVITVSGHFTADGQVVARRIDPYSGAPLWLLRGVLTALPDNRLAIGTLELDLASAAREGFPGSAPLPGDAVLVTADQAPVNGVLTAKAVRCTGGCDSARWDTGRLFGLVTGWRSGMDFDIDGRTIRALSCECLSGEPTPIGSPVNVYLADRAARVIRYPGSYRAGVSGAIDSLDVGLGELTVAGQRVLVTPATLIAEASAGGTVRTVATIADLKPGDPVTVTGDAAQATIFAGAIGRQRSAWDFHAVYSLLSMNAPTIELLGRTIATDGSTVVSRCGAGSFSLDWMFGLGDDDYFWLDITLSPSASSPLAARIDVCSYAWD